MFLGLAFDVVVEESGSRGHVETLAGLDVFFVVNLHEVGGVLPGEGDAGGAVGLVADDEIEVIHAELLGFVDGLDGLVGGEDDVEALAALALLRTQLDVRTVGGDGDIEIVGGDVLGLLGDLLVRAYGVRLERQVGLRLRGPLLERL